MQLVSLYFSKDESEEKKDWMWKYGWVDKSGRFVPISEKCRYPAQGRRPESSPDIHSFYYIIFLSLAHPNLVLLPILGPQEGLRPPKSTAQNSRL